MASRGNPSPAGGATWSGIMLGMDHLEPGAWRFVRGDAGVTPAFDAMEVDVAFTGIARTDGTASWPDMVWDGVPMRGGQFASPGIQGRFFGNRHQEAGGVFDRNGIVGAFGAARGPG